VQFPDKVAIEECESGSTRYGELVRLADRVRDRLRKLEVEPGDRVGICMRKSADAVALLFGIMKAGAAYVPADPTARPSRNAFIFHNCAVKVVIVEAYLADQLREEFKRLGFAPEEIVIDGVGAGVPLMLALDRLISRAQPARCPARLRIHLVSHTPYTLPVQPADQGVPARARPSLVSDRRHRYRTSRRQLQIPGRRDRMIKKRGYRIELGEIEVALYRHPAVKEAAVLAFPDDDGIPIKAFISTRDGSKLSTIELKKFWSENLPLYMVPDFICSLESLPKT